LEAVLDAWLVRTPTVAAACCFFVLHAVLNIFDLYVGACMDGMLMSSSTAIMQWPM
jgi:hypothetical protein